MANGSVKLWGRAKRLAAVVFGAAVSIGCGARSELFHSDPTADAIDGNDAADATRLPSCGDRDASNATTAVRFCDLGTPVPGAVVPDGFCVRRFATIRTPRTLTFAANGDLFVASPSSPPLGGAPAGLGAIVVMTDADLDGTAELHTFIDGIDVHGVA